MDKSQMKSLGIACLVICVTCVFVAVERYTTNAWRVGLNSDIIRRSETNSTVHVKMLTGELDARITGNGSLSWLEPVTPTITVYAGFFALLSGVGGIVLLVKSKT
jgi:hypothetical protein